MQHSYPSKISPENEIPGLTPIIHPSMTKILILTAYYRPEMIASSFLDDNRYEAFVRNGFELCIHTPVPCRGVSDEVRKEYGRKRRETEYDGMATVHRFGLLREGKNPVGRAVRYTLCCVRLMVRGAFAKDADLLYAVSTPPILGAAAAVVKKIKRIPFIYNLQDIFPDSLAGTGLTSKGSLLWRIGRRIENFTYRNADKIVVISEDFKRNIMAKGVPQSKIEVVYNWVDENAVVPVKRSNNQLIARYGLDRDKFYVTYCGNIGLTQNMSMLMEAAEELLPYPDIQFIMIGEGAYKKEMERMVAERGLDNVRMLPFQPYEDISHVFSLGDVGLVISKPGVGENSVPSKTWSIMSAARPVLASFDENSLKNIIETNQAGIFTPAGDKAAFIKAILFLYQNPKAGESYGENGRNFILGNLTREAGTSKYVEILKQFAKHHSQNE